MEVLICILYLKNKLSYKLFWNIFFECIHIYISFSLQNCTCTYSNNASIAIFLKAYLEVFLDLFCFRKSKKFLPQYLQFITLYWKKFQENTLKKTHDIITIFIFIWPSLFIFCNFLYYVSHVLLFYFSYLIIIEYLITSDQ